MKKCEPITEKNGRVAFDLDATVASSDWMRFGRLKRLADAGDKEAQAECERMENTPLYVIDE
jgi:hypothetical protein